MTTTKTKPKAKAKKKVKIVGRGQVEFDSLVPALDECQRIVRWAYSMTGDRDLAAPKITCIIQTRGQKKACLGRFTPNGWATREGAPVHELMIAAETMHRPLLEIVETLIHETVHLWCYDMGISDCSLSGRHNKKYAEHARMIGLNCEIHPTATQGWALTTLTADLLERVEGELKPDVAAFMLAKTVKLVTPKEPTQRAWRCGCQVVRASKNVTMDSKCNLCNKPWKVAA